MEAQPQAPPPAHEQHRQGRDLLSGSPARQEGRPEPHPPGVRVRSQLADVPRRRIQAAPRLASQPVQPDVQGARDWLRVFARPCRRLGHCARRVRLALRARLTHQPLPDPLFRLRFVARRRHLPPPYGHAHSVVQRLAMD